MRKSDKEVAVIEEIIKEYLSQHNNGLGGYPTQLAKGQLDRFVEWLGKEGIVLERRTKKSESGSIFKRLMGL